MALNGKVAIVTGASRGIGKGIARELGAAGATVVVTGRSVDPESHRLGGSVQQTADLVTAVGGVGVARPVDHAEDAQVRDLVAGVIEDFGRIDILVNNVFNTPEPTTPDEVIFGPFWLTPIWAWDAMHDVGLRSHFVASWFVAPHMVAARSGLIVNISSLGARDYYGSVAYSVGKTGVDRLAQTMAVDLVDHNVAALALYPGTVRTERMVEAVRLSDGAYDLDGAESPELAGRAVVALAEDPQLMKKTGRALAVANLAHEYEFAEDDGTVPPRIDLD
ncbi:MAG: SDR family NAD(P)-dependent oxidoreductase [Candidatus Nanopelagicales bacterium]